jgi:hypothetical protein
MLFRPISEKQNSLSYKNASDWILTDEHISNTVTPVLRGHLWDKIKIVLYNR